MLQSSFKRTACVTFVVCLGFLVGIINYNLAKLPDNNFAELLSYKNSPRVEDRNGNALNLTYQNDFNLYDNVSLYQLNDIMLNAIVTSEDKRFYKHYGVDCLAKLNALIQNIKAFRVVRGGSTITEQVIRIIKPRKRSLWSKLLEAIDAIRLEKRFSKQEILEFYVNQIPFAANRRGVIQASQYYFDHSLSTLTKEEMLSLVVLVRAPSSYDPKKNPKSLMDRVKKLAQKMGVEGSLSDNYVSKIVASKNPLHKSKQLQVNMPNFINYLKNNYADLSGNTLKTTIDAELQLYVQKLLENRLNDLSDYEVNNGAVLAVDYKKGEILIWAVAGEISDDIDGRFYDAITMPRQPGSTLKPFVYAMAIDEGWQPNTIIKDEPIYSQVNNGLHVYKNYSELYYGDVTLAQALGNSLNTPAVKALEYVGVYQFANKLKSMGVHGLNDNVDLYGSGLILGNAEISLFDMVQVYSCLANNGICPDISPIYNGSKHDYSSAKERIFSDKSARQISSILSDDRFRELEFGRHGILDFPINTAAKTGTSARANDVWTFAYDNEFIVGVWLGNVNRATPAKPISGAVGAGILARSVFAELRRQYGIYPLEQVDLDMNDKANQSNDAIDLVVPTNNMIVLYDPRIPDDKQAISFYIKGLREENIVQWFVDDKKYTTKGDVKLTWKVSKGWHKVKADIYDGKKIIKLIPWRNFEVK